MARGLVCGTIDYDAGQHVTASRSEMQNAAPCQAVCGDGGRALFYSVRLTLHLAGGPSKCRGGSGLDQPVQESKQMWEVKAMGAMLMEIIDSRVMPNYQ